MLYAWLQTDGELNFATFTLHMFPGVLLVAGVSYVLIRAVYTCTDLLRSKEPPGVQLSSCLCKSNLSLVSSDLHM